MRWERIYLTVWVLAHGGAALSVSWYVANMTVPAESCREDFADSGFICTGYREHYWVAFALIAVGLFIALWAIRKMRNDD